MVTFLFSHIDKLTPFNNEVLKLDIVKLQVLCLGLGVDFTFTWDNNNNHNDNEKDNPHLHFFKGTVLGDNE